MNKLKLKIGSRKATIIIPFDDTQESKSIWAVKLFEFKSGHLTEINYAQ